MQMALIAITPNYGLKNNDTRRKEKNTSFFSALSAYSEEA